MNYKELSETKKFKELLQQIPAEERQKVEDALKTMVEDFEKNVIRPLEAINRR